MCSRSDGIGPKVKSLGYKILILSTEKNRVAEEAEKLNVECIHGSENKLIIY